MSHPGGPQDGEISRRRAEITARRDAGLSWIELAEGLGLGELAWQLEHRALDADAARMCEVHYRRLVALIGRSGPDGLELAIHTHGDQAAAELLARSEHPALRRWAACQDTLSETTRLHLTQETDPVVLRELLAHTGSSAVAHQAIETLRVIGDGQDHSIVLTRGVELGGRVVLWVLRNASVHTTVAWLCGELSVRPRPGELRDLAMDPGFAWRTRGGEEQLLELREGLARMEHLERTAPWRAEARELFDPARIVNTPAVVPV